MLRLPSPRPGCRQPCRSMQIARSKNHLRNSRLSTPSSLISAQEWLQKCSKNKLNVSRESSPRKRARRPRQSQGHLSLRRDHLRLLTDHISTKERATHKKISTPSICANWLSRPSHSRGQSRPTHPALRPMLFHSWREGKTSRRNASVKKRPRKRKKKELKNKIPRKKKSKPHWRSNLPSLHPR